MQNISKKEFKGNDPIWSNYVFTMLLRCVTCASRLVRHNDRPEPPSLYLCATHLKAKPHTLSTVTTAVRPTDLHPLHHHLSEPSNTSVRVDWDPPSSACGAASQSFSVKAPDSLTIGRKFGDENLRFIWGSKASGSDRVRTSAVLNRIVTKSTIVRG